MDLLTVITDYLKSHKRLVIPQLGVFLVKEPGKSLVFSELMKRDDGVLRELLCARGLSEIEASGRIDRFVFEVRHAVEGGSEYPLAGFGTMKPGPNGTIAFEYKPAEGEAAAVPSEPEVPAETPSATSHIDTARMAETMRTAFREEAARSAADSEEETPRSVSAGVTPEPAPRRKPAYTLEEAYADHQPPKRKMDRFLLIAIVAAVLAIAAIAFGFWRESQEFSDDDLYLEENVMSETPLE